MEGIYYIENTVSEYASRITGYFPTLDEAKNELKKCSDWWSPAGTGRIYYVKFGLNPHPILVYKA